jgi:hypothetical protein
MSFSGVEFFGSTQNGLIADNVTVTNTLDWSDVVVTPQTVLKLSDASVRHLRDETRSWPVEGSLLIDGFTYTSFSMETDPTTAAAARLRWLKRQPRHPFHWQPYEQLAQVLRNSGQEALARRVQIEKHEMRRKHAGLTFLSRVLNWILKVTIGHGYQPSRALAWSAAFIVFGGVVFGVGNAGGLMVPSEKNVPHNTASAAPWLSRAPYVSFDALVYSLDNFLPS